MTTSFRSRRFGGFTAWALAATTFVSVAAAGAAPVSAETPTDLFISEYVEGSSNNKAIEIYNGTGVDVDLAPYTLSFSFNGNTVAATNIDLTGVVASGDVFVVADNDSATPILDVADQQSNSSFFNGDDAITLSKDGVIIDSFGQIGIDPGSEWTGGGANDTLRRLPDVCAGDSDATDDFDVSLEYEVLAQDTFDGLGTHTTNCGPTAPTTPVINEFSANTTGVDVEYVEILADPDTDLSALTVLEIEGDSNSNMGAIDEVIEIGTTDSNGFFLASLPANALENGTISLLLVDGFTGAAGDDLDVDNDGTLDVTPWSSIVDGIATNDGGTGDITYAVELGVAYDGLSFSPGGASRIPDGIDTDTTSDWVRNDFDLAGIPGFIGSAVEGEALNTPGAPNEVYVTPPPPPLDCVNDFTFTTIGAIQGTGDVSPLADTIVTIEGTVVADFQTDPNGNNPLRGFNVQDAGDGDPATSDGIFVFNDSTEVAVGDVVRVQGEAVEFGGLTELSSATVVVCSSGATLPEATVLELPVDSADEFEAVESMLVTFPQDLVISEYFNFDRFGEIVLTDARQATPTAVVEPGQPAIDLAAEQALASITLDDAVTNQNPDPARHPNGDPFTLDNRFRGGDTVANVTGVMYYGFGLYRIQPTEGADYTSVNPRTAAPDDVGGDVKVASFNVLNYFTTLDNAGPICGPAQNADCRGANDAEELVRQRDKIVSAITAIDADVVGLIEIENNVDDDAVIDLVSSLNAAAGADIYASISTGTIGTDAIKVALIYQPAVVTPAGAYAILDESVDPRFIDDKNRPALAQTFTENATGSSFTVTVNHLKSKGSNCNDVGDPDTGDGAGNCNITRTQAAQALVDWLATDPTGSGDADALIIGDLNSYDEEEPIDAIIAGADDTVGTTDDYTDLVQKYQGDEAYSYVFDGKTGYLDHALASTTLTEQITGTTVWHINADEADLLDYDTGFKLDAQDAIYAPDPYRSSDHDPVVIGLDLTEPVGDLTIDRALLVLPRRGGGTAILAGSVEDSFSSCPTFELSIADQVVAGGDFVKWGRYCISLTRSGLVKFDLRTSSFTAVLSLPRDFELAGTTAVFGLTLDDSAYATDVTGRRFGSIWSA